MNQIEYIARNKAKSGGPTVPDPRLVYYYHPDYLGNVEYITDMNGLPYQYFWYSPWGEALHDQKANISPNDWSTPYKFNGKEQDDETGLYYYGARYYNPQVSVWLAVDPLAEKYPNLSSYTFVANNPIMLIDPDGRDIWVLDENDKLILKEQTNDDFNIFLDSEGNEIFRTNEKMSYVEGENSMQRLDNYKKVLGNISLQDGVYEKMKARADETGFDNTILKEGIEGLKVNADNYTFVRNPRDKAIDKGLDLILPSPKVKLFDDAEDARRAYNVVTGGRDLNKDSKTTVASFLNSMFDSTTRGFNKFTEKISSFFSEFHGRIEHYGRTGVRPF